MVLGMNSADASDTLIGWDFTSPNTVRKVARSRGETVNNFIRRLNGLSKDGSPSPVASLPKKKTRARRRQRPPSLVPVTLLTQIESAIHTTDDVAEPETPKTTREFSQDAFSTFTQPKISPPASVPVTPSRTRLGALRLDSPVPKRRRFNPRDSRAVHSSQGASGIDTAAPNATTPKRGTAKRSHIKASVASPRHSNRFQSTHHSRERKTSEISAGEGSSLADGWSPLNTADLVGMSLGTTSDNLPSPIFPDFADAILSQPPSTTTVSGLPAAQTVLQATEADPTSTTTTVSSHNVTSAQALHWEDDSFSDSFIIASAEGIMSQTSPCTGGPAYEGASRSPTEEPISDVKTPTVSPHTCERVGKLTHFASSALHSPAQVNSSTGKGTNPVPQTKQPQTRDVPGTGFKFRKRAGLLSKVTCKSD